MFSIASEIKCGTVDELESRMSLSERAEWGKYFKIRRQERKKQRKRGRKKGRHT